MKRTALPLAFILFLLTACGKGSEETAQIPGTSTPLVLPSIWTLTPTPTENLTRIFPSPDEVIALWETYRNERYGYEIQHPPDWIVSSELSMELDVSWVFIENKDCYFRIDEGDKGHAFDKELENEGCFIDQVYFNDIKMNVIHCPNDPLEYRFPINGKYLYMSYGNRNIGEWLPDLLRIQPTPFSDLDPCQEISEQIYSTFYFFRLVEKENQILLKVAQNLPQGFKVLEISYVDFDGDGIEEIVIVGHLKIIGKLGVYIFKADMTTNDVRKVYFNDINGQGFIKLSASDMDNDGKEDLMIQASDPSVDLWHLLSMKDNEIRMFNPPPINPIDFDLGHGYDLSGIKHIWVLPDGTILERNFLSLNGKDGLWFGSLEMYYKFHNNIFFIAGYELHKSADTPNLPPTPTPKPTATPIIIGTPPADWKVFRSSNYGFRIMHPKKISISKEETGILLHHSIPHEHRDPCDFRGDAPPLQELTDFEVWIEVVPQSLRETIISMEMEDYVQEFLGEDELLLKPGYRNKEINIGSLRGYSIEQGVEGCGRYVYFFPLSDRSTLFIVRSIITELTHNVTNYQDYLSLPGIIPPEEEEQLFYQILSTFELIE